MRGGGWGLSGRLYGAQSFLMDVLCITTPCFVLLVDNILLFSLHCYSWCTLPGYHWITSERPHSSGTLHQFHNDSPVLYLILLQNSTLSFPCCSFLTSNSFFWHIIFSHFCIFLSVQHSFYKSLSYTIVLFPNYCHYTAPRIHSRSTMQVLWRMTTSPTNQGQYFKLF